MNNQLELAFNQIVERVEPLTRFDRTALKQESGLVRAVAGRAFWRFSPSITNNREEHTGRPPYHAARVGGPAELDEVARKTLQSGYDALPRRIQSWLAANELTDRKLEASHCFDGPKTYGYDYKCDKCLGDGWVKCPACVDGYNPCGSCKTKGHFDCSKCTNIWGNSTGMVKCKGCGGSGKHDGQRCQHCNGGKITCPACGGNKIVDCRPCGGKGYILCSTCHGKDRVDCLPCDKTGYFQVLRTVTCTVSDNFRVDLKDAKREVVSQLARRDLEGLRALASVTQKKPTVRDNVVEREYDFECVITEIGVQAAGGKLDMIGFGGKARIFDFKSIVPVILDADLHTLDDAVAKTPYRLWGSPTELTTATSRFLDSEVNIRIDDQMLLSEGIVDGNYVSRVKTLLPAALGRIVAANLWLPLLVTALVPAALYLAFHFTRLLEESGNWLLIAPLLAAPACWVLLERRMLNRLRSILKDDAGVKVDAPLRQYYLLWKVRGLALAFLIFSLAAAALIVTLLPVPPNQ